MARRQRTPDRVFVPPVQTLQVRYAKRGRMRFASHRDFQRAWERALRRVQVPMAYSAGFSPHPKVSYMGAAPTGAASEAEFLEFSVVEHVEPDLLARELDASLPEGLDIVALAQGVRLNDVLQASRWRLEFPRAVTADVAAFEAADSVEVERITKAGRRLIDVRSLCSDFVVAGSVLELTVRHAEPTPRPAEIVKALGLGDTPVLATRLVQGSLVEGAVKLPF
jgi:radical SAM-linked protein